MGHPQGDPAPVSGLGNPPGDLHHLGNSPRPDAGGIGLKYSKQIHVSNPFETHKTDSLCSRVCT